MKLLRTIIKIEYDGFIYSKNLGQLLLLAAGLDNFIFLEIKDPTGKKIYSCQKEPLEKE